ncbi:hypothetical protein GCM10022286_12760 [Gryllotalpicola daejeonensis]|uniref:Anti-sigma factor antagonist n=1 Tax=Gryllotalpicola daejeonensis TaxID=993087 RepID=A0ABP7ZI98_9MICO
MDHTVEEVGDDAAVITLAGRVNMVTAPAVRELITGIISAGRVRIAVDLDAVEFIDSSALGSLIGCLNAARRANGDLRISRPTKHILAVLEVSNLIQLLRPYPSAHAALEA